MNFVHIFLILPALIASLLFWGRYKPYRNFVILLISNWLLYSLAFYFFRISGLPAPFLTGLFLLMIYSFRSFKLLSVCLIVVQNFYFLVVQHVSPSQLFIQTGLITVITVFVLFVWILTVNREQKRGNQFFMP